MKAGNARIGFAVVVLSAGAFAANPDVLAKGKSIYDAKCSQCHGESGDGKGIGAEFFDPKPRDFTSGAFKIRTTESGELPTHADLKEIIRLGMPYTGMPPWPRLTEAELDAVTEYVKTFNEDFADTSFTPKSLPIPKPPKFTPESAEKGKAVYAENKCMDCHGQNGRGNGESGPTLKDDAGNPIRPADLTKPWTFRGGSRPEDLYRTFTTGLNGTPMPSYSNAIGEEDRWHLVNYLKTLAPTEKPPYATAVVGEYADSLDLARGPELFANAKPALFPVVGQVIEDPRSYAPGVNAVEVRAVFDSQHVALMVSWHDMSPEKGSNVPVLQGEPPSPLSDAMAVQIPLREFGGPATPYFLFGDRKNPVEIWFSDLGAGSTTRFSGQGNSRLTPLDGQVESRSEYVDGEWRVYLKRARRPEGALALEAGQFIPLAFSIWDGFSGESGSKRGITSWYSLYLKPPAASPFVPAAAKGGAWLLGQLVLILWLRRRYGTQPKPQ